MSTRITVQEHDEAVRVGDTVTVWHSKHEGIVTEVTKRRDNSVETVVTKTVMGDELTWDTTLASYKFEVTKKAPVTPQHWPPQPEDVWQAGDELYHVMGSRMYRSSDPGTVWTSPDNLLKSCNGGYGQFDKRELKLVYRKGNDPNV